MNKSHNYQHVPLMPDIPSASAQIQPVAESAVRRIKINAVKRTLFEEKGQRILI